MAKFNATNSVFSYNARVMSTSLRIQFSTERPKHIEERDHFIKDNMEKGDILLDFVPANISVADISTKPGKDQFYFIRRDLGWLTISHKLGVLLALSMVRKMFFKGVNF